MSLLSKFLFLGLGAIVGGGFFFFFGVSRAKPSERDEAQTLSEATTPPLPSSAPKTVQGEEKDEPREWFLGFALGKRIAFDPKLLQRYELIQDRCTVGFDGKSTIHDFTGSTKNLSGFFEARLARLEEGVQGRLTIDAVSLDTKDPDRDREMHENHLHTKRFPRIALELKGFSGAVWNESYDSGKGSLLAEVEIHGVRRNVAVAVSIARRDHTLQVRGRVALLMSEFGITPPSKFAVIRVQDEVQVWFDIQAKLSAVEGQRP